LLDCDADAIIPAVALLILHCFCISSDPCKNCCFRIYF
jgi:hypothetical protein